MLVFATSLPIALLIGVPTRGVGLGLAMAVILGAVTWRARVGASGDRVAFARALAEAQATAEERVAVVTRQFEWTANDVAKLREALSDAQSARTLAEATAREATRRLDELRAELIEARTTIAELAAKNEGAADDVLPRRSTAKRRTDKRGRVWSPDPRAPTAPVP